MTDDFSNRPYAQWLESIIKEMFEIDPAAISIQMRDGKGETYTCYWNVSADDRAIMIDAMQTDKLVDLLKDMRGDTESDLEGEEENGADA